MKNLAAATHSTVLAAALACLALAPAASAQVTFAPQAAHAVGDAPRGVAVGDFNDDGDPDLGVANELGLNAADELTGSVSILLGGPGGHFYGQTVFESPYPEAVAVADFNFDGDPDLALASQGVSSGLVSILPGGASGSFGAATDHAVGERPRSMAIADFNFDGLPDIAAPNFGSDTLSVLLRRPGLGGVTFEPQTVYATDLGPHAAATADFNADGEPDLATANTYSDDVSVLLGQPSSGGFGPKTTYAAGDGPAGLAAGDFNADGDPDLAVADEQSGRISVLLGGAGGSFGAPTNYVTDAGPTSVAIADFDADGDPDLAVGHSASNNVSVLRGAAGGTFAASTEYPTGADPFSVASEDFNSDGRPDLATANFDDDTVSVLLNTTTPNSGYPRPKGATPVHASLVPAYNACGAPNRQHGPPLAFPSCNPPARSSGFLTVGSPDANGATVNFIGSVRYVAAVGAPGGPDDSDVTITVSILDVRNSGTLTDYTGQVQVNHSLRITDRLNGVSETQPGTVQDTTFPVTVGCTATASTSIGGTCALMTSADAVLPGSAPEGKRAIWEMGQVSVNDGGADGLASTGPNQPFARQGVFVP